MSSYFKKESFIHFHIFLYVSLRDTLFEFIKWRQSLETHKDWIFEI